MHCSITSLVALALASTLLGAGCSSDVSSPTSPSATGGTTSLTADQTAGTWTLTSIEPTGQTAQTVPPGAFYELAIAEGRVSTKADCNTCAGNLVVSGQTVTIGPLLACTRAACPTMAFENTYVGILAGDSAARIDGNSLTLTSSRGVLRFRR